MDTLTANRIFWGLLAMAAIGFLVYLMIVLGQRELGKIGEQLTQLNRNIESQKVDIDKLKANESNNADETAKSQIQGLTSQVQSLNEILRSVAPQLQAHQKEIEQIKTQLQQDAGGPVAVLKHVQMLEAENKNLQSAMSELRASIGSMSQLVKEFEQKQKTLEQVLEPVLMIDNPMPYSTACPQGYSALEITFQIWSANTELDRLHDDNRDRLICKPATVITSMLPLASQTVGAYRPEDDVTGPSGMR